MTFDIHILSFLTELVGTVAFSISGAMLAIERNLDLFGVVFLGAITAIGGGIVRDLLLGQIPPQAFLNYVYLLFAVLTALVVFVIARWRASQGKSIQFMNDTVLNIFDAAGLGIFSVIGVQNTIDAGFGSNAFFCVFLGMTTGVGAGCSGMCSAAPLRRCCASISMLWPLWPARYATICFSFTPPLSPFW